MYRHIMLQGHELWKALVSWACGSCRRQNMREFCEESTFSKTENEMER
jgi:cytidine deaminase